MATALTQLPWPLSTRSAAPVVRSHSRAVLSPDTVTARRPSGVTAAPPTPSWWPARTCRHAPPARSHSRAVASEDIVSARAVPPGSSSTPPTLSAWPASTCRQLPAGSSHTRAVPSSLAVSASEPSSASATPRMRAECPCRVALCAQPPAGSPGLAADGRHTRPTWSSPAVSTSAVGPRPADAQACTPSVCPARQASCWPLSTSQTRAVPSREVVRRHGGSWDTSAASVMWSVCPSSTVRRAPLARSHTRAVLSVLTVAAQAPQALTRPPVTHELCPPSCASRPPDTCPRLGVIGHSGTVPWLYVSSSRSARMNRIQSGMSGWLTCATRRDAICTPSMESFG
mmetsp:Transcript_13057/g.33039  ORF Transcript_13057/g.33039 Transcript_13057/m.33039 type:complete len:342 (-) Transcript_13057:835-1860(-)